MSGIIYERYYIFARHSGKKVPGGCVGLLAGKRTDVVALGGGTCCVVVCCVVLVLLHDNLALTYMIDV